MLRRRSSFLSICAFAFSAFVVIAQLDPPLSSAAKPQVASSKEKLAFETHIRPILKAHCFDCHGDTKEVKGELDIRLVRLMKKGGESGPAIVPGDRKKSNLFEQIVSHAMPPGEKKLNDADIATIGRWIDAGAPTLKPEPENVSAFTEEEQAFWAFQPIKQQSVPPVKSDIPVRTPIDAFLAAELQKEGLSFSPEASREALCRRVYFDLLGLPPTPAELDAFIHDKSTHAYEALIDRLLSSPHYGERWGRHWLDIAGYSDSDGYTPLDPERKYIFKYRDYVIRSFNDDKPWNEFIVEQLAGDELFGSPVKPPIGENLDKLIATGYLRMGPDGTSDADVDQSLARNDVMAETLKIVSTSLLGLSVGCAQCHNHRYDPIPQTDYYRFRAIFEPAYDWKNWRGSKGRLVSTLTPEQKKEIAKIDAELQKLQGQRSVAYRKIADELFEIELNKVPEEFHETIRKARPMMAQRRSMEQAELFKKYPALNVTPEAVEAFDKERYDAMKQEFDPAIAKLKAIPRPTEDFVHALTEVPAKISPTLVFFRGDHNQPREEVSAGELSILDNGSVAAIPVDDPSVPTTGRRLAYAKHLTSGKHPLVARVLVNRFWLNHFGRGLVASPGDFGYLGQRPSHPELLDWLASDFMQGEWRLKRLHKMIMLSTAYRQTSVRTEKLDAVDPDNLLLGRMSVRRLDAETLRDSVLAVSGKLNPKMFGTPVPVTPDESGQVVLGIDTRDGAGRFQRPVGSVGNEAFRRSIYVQARRSAPLGMLETFDAPEMTPNCECRSTSTVTPQSLLLMNSDFVIQQAALFAERLQREAQSDTASQVQLAWRIAFGTTPTEAQINAAKCFIETQSEVFERTIKKPAPPTTASPANGKAAPKPAPEPPSADQRALTLFCQSLLSANGFLYVD